MFTASDGGAGGRRRNHGSAKPKAEGAKAKLERGESGRWTTVNQEQDAIELGNHFCSCGNKLIEHTTELRIVLTYEATWRLPSHGSERTKAAWNAASKPQRASPAQRSQREAEISYNNGERQTLSPRNTVRHLIPSPLPAKISTHGHGFSTETRVGVHTAHAVGRTTPASCRPTPCLNDSCIKTGRGPTPCTHL